jgi:hypothetical protein
MEAIEQRWRKSSRSGNGAECVEVAAAHPGTVAVRDSKNPDGPVLIIGRDEWASFTTRVRSAT